MIFWVILAKSKKKKKKNPQPLFGICSPVEQFFLLLGLKVAFIISEILHLLCVTILKISIICYTVLFCDTQYISVVGYWVIAHESLASGQHNQQISPRLVIREKLLPLGIDVLKPVTSRDRFVTNTNLPYSTIQLYGKFVSLIT